MCDEPPEDLSFAPPLSPPCLAARRCVAMDDSCLFHCFSLAAVAAGRSDSAPSAMALREVCAQEALNNLDPEAKAVAVDNSSIQEYVESVRCRQTWGGENEIVTLGSHLGVEVGVISASSLSILVYGTKAIPPRRTRIYLLYTGNHYDLFVVRAPAPAEAGEEVASAEGAALRCHVLSCDPFVPALEASMLQIALDHLRSEGPTLDTKKDCAELNGCIQRIAGQLDPVEIAPLRRTGGGKRKGTVEWSALVDHLQRLLSIQHERAVEQGLEDTTAEAPTGEASTCGEAGDAASSLAATGSDLSEDGDIPKMEEPREKIAEEAGADDGPDAPPEGVAEELSKEESVLEDLNDDGLEGEAQVQPEELPEVEAVTCEAINDEAQDYDVLRSVSDAWATERTHMQQVIHMLQRDNRQCAASVEDYRARLTKARDELSAADAAKAQELQRIHAQHEATTLELRSQLQSKSAEVAKLTHSGEEFRQSDAQKAEEIKQLVQSKDELRESLTEKAEEIGRLQQSYRDLKTLDAQKAAQIAELEGSKATLQERIAAAAADVEQLSENLSRLTQELDEVSAADAAKAKKIQRLHAQHEATSLELRSQLQSKSAEVAKLTQAVQELRHADAQKAEEIKRLHQQHETTSTELKGQQQTKQAEIEQLVQSGNELRESIGCLQQSYRDLKLQKGVVANYQDGIFGQKHKGGKTGKASGKDCKEQRATKGKAKGKGKDGKGMALVPAPGKDEEGFALVDSRPIPHKGSKVGGKKGKGKSKGVVANDQEGILGQKQKPFFSSNRQSKGGKEGNGEMNSLLTFKEWSVQKKTDWNVMREIQLSMRPRLQIHAWEGFALVDSRPSPYQGSKGGGKKGKGKGKSKAAEPSG